MSVSESALAKFLPFLSSPNANDERRTSEFTAQSHSIINSAKSFDNFRREARDKNLTTSAGIKEMLHERYTRKLSGEIDLDVSGKLDDSETSLKERQSIQPRQDSYRRKIRGDTDGILGYDEFAQKRGSKGSARLNRIASNLSSSLTRLADESRMSVRQERHISRGLSRSLVDARGRSTLMSLLFDDTSDGELEQGTHDHDSSESGIEEEGEVHPTSIQQASESNSDDDRSNNGNFEYYPVPTKQETLQRRRSYRKDMRQSLPPKCERFIGIIEAVSGTPIHDDQGAADSAAGMSKSMPPNSTVVDRAELQQIENDHCNVTRYHESPTDQSSDEYPCRRRSLSFNSEIIADLKRCLLEEATSDRNYSDQAVIAPRSLSHSLPPNSHLAPTRDLLQNNERRKIVRLHSNSLPPKKSHDLLTQERPVIKENFNSSFVRRQTATTDDLTQYTDGSELLVNWGDCVDSSYGE